MDDTTLFAERCVGQSELRPATAGLVLACLLYLARARVHVCVWFLSLRGPWNFKLLPLDSVSASFQATSMTTAEARANQFPDDLYCMLAITFCFVGFVSLLSRSLQTIWNRRSTVILLFNFNNRGILRNPWFHAAEFAKIWRRKIHGSGYSGIQRPQVTCRLAWDMVEFTQSSRCSARWLMTFRTVLLKLARVVSQGVVSRSTVMKDLLL